MPDDEKIDLMDDVTPVNEDGDEDNQVDVTESDLKTDEDGDDTEAPDTQGDEEAKDDSDDEADEFAEDDKEWLAQFEGMPDGIDSVEKLAESYTASLKEMNSKQRNADKFAQVEAAARAKGYESVDAFLAGNVAAQQPPQPTAPATEQGGESYFAPNPVRTVIDSMLKEGSIPQESVASYNAVAKVVDNAITPQFQKAEQVMTLAMQQVLAMRETVKKLEWGAVPESVRGSISRSEVDKLIDNGAFQSIEDAIQFLHFKNPGLLKDIATKAEEKGVEKGRKKLRKSRAIRRGKGKPTARKWDFHKYQDSDGNWDNKKMSKLPIDDSIKMLEDYEKQNFS